MNTTPHSHDLIVIGAGPAGMAAATTASELGLSVALVDEQTLPGGQIYRSVGEPAPADTQLLGPDYAHGKALVTALDAASVDYLPGATVWQISQDLEVALSMEGTSRLLRAPRIILATGAMERPVPFPGWTLPGVMSCGAAQILLKSAALVPERVVLVGSGPLLLLLGCQLLDAGVKIDAVLDTTPWSNWPRALPYLPGALRSWPYLLKGLRYLFRLRRAGIPWYNAASGLQARADDRGHLAGLRFQSGGKTRNIDCEFLLLHQGVVPNVQITRSLEAEHIWDELQRCWRPVTDEWGNTSVPGVLVAGDGAGIGGAWAAEHQGRLAALAAAHDLERLSTERRDQLARTERAALAPHRPIRPFLDALYAPAAEFLRPADDTVVCRCEEVSAGDIRRFVSMGCLGPNQTKAFGRSGMGPCQGRLCGLTVSELIAGERGVSPAEVGYYHIRPPIKPVTLGELAGLAEAEESLPTN